MIPITKIIDKSFILVSTTGKWLKHTTISDYNRRSKKPIHVLFCLVDHYEPGNGNVTEEIARARVDLLITEYPKLADRHKDCAGNPPKRTWFFPPHYHSNYHLRDLASLCNRGYGEIELHLHHGKTEPDNAENLENTIRQCVREYSRFGIFGAEDGVTKYGFIHGDWALDNSRNGKFCGVNNEISILNKTGCYADFTFPSMNESDPKKINSIYYASDDPHKPKSHNTGVDVRSPGTPTGDLLMVQGPLYPFWTDNKIFGLRVRGDVINGNPPVTENRIDAWIRTGICVNGKEEWIIVKTHTHGAPDYKAVLGKEMDDIFKYLETRYNDGVNYKLHYCTAREIYNVIKAAEAGEAGADPQEYKNYKISAPGYNASPNIAGASEELKQLVARTYRG